MWAMAESLVPLPSSFMCRKIAMALTAPSIVVNCTGPRPGSRDVPEMPAWMRFEMAPGFDWLAASHVAALGTVQEPGADNCEVFAALHSTSDWYTKRQSSRFQPGHHRGRSSRACS